MSSSIRAPLLGAAVLVACMPAAAAGQSQDTPSSHVRPLSHRLADAIGLMERRSATFRALVAGLDASDVVVHLVEQQGPCPGGVNSCLVVVSDRGGYRYLRVMVREMQPYSALLAEVAHELKHAEEIASQAWIRSEGQACDGVDRRAGASRCETRAAQAFAYKVMGEVQGKR